MRTFSIFLMVLTMTIWSGCATRASDPFEEGVRVYYYDRNGDGKVDLEKHKYPPGITDSDWELRDDDYNGRYEQKILYGVGVFKSAVDIPVPTDVPIETKP